MESILDLFQTGREEMEQQDHQVQMLLLVAGQTPLAQAARNPRLISSNLYLP